MELWGKESELWLNRNGSNWLEYGGVNRLIKVYIRILENKIKYSCKDGRNCTKITG